MDDFYAEEETQQAMNEKEYIEFYPVEADVLSLKKMRKLQFTK